MSPDFRSRSLVAVAALAVAVLVMPLAASADQYVLTAGNWGAKQADAVAAAGGQVVWCHGGTGIGVATSDDPDFLSQVEGSKRVQQRRPGRRDPVAARDAGPAGHHPR